MNIDYAFIHSIEVIDYIFVFFWINIDASTDNDIFFSAHDEEISRFVLKSNITRLEPTFSKYFSCLCRVCVIPRHPTR